MEQMKTQVLKKYQISVTETLSKTVTVEAEDRTSAIKLVKEQYKNEDIVLYPGESDVLCLTSFSYPERIISCTSELTPVAEVFDQVMMKAHISVAETSLIFGYLEGHGYTLFKDEEQNLYLYDDCYGEDCEDAITPYSLKELINLISSWNDELTDADDHDYSSEKITKLKLDRLMIDKMLKKL